MDYISGTEDAYKIEPKKFTVRVSFHGESDKSYGVLVDLIINKETNGYSASRLEWFPKSLCEIEKKEVAGIISEYHLTAPEWLLKSKNVKYGSQSNPDIKAT